jgi:hypothetical protein
MFGLVLYLLFRWLATNYGLQKKVADRQTESTGAQCTSARQAMRTSIYHSRLTGFMADVEPNVISY